VVAVLLVCNLVSAQSSKTQEQFELNDSHFHLTNYIQQGIDIHDFLKLMGTRVGDLIHHTHADGTLFPAEDCPIFQVFRTEEGIHAEDEVLWRANKTSFPAEYWSYPQRREQEVVGAVVAFVDITQRKLTEAALASVSRRLIDAQEQERTRIARELHDDVGQRLAMLAVELEQVCQGCADLLLVRSRVGELQKQTSEIASDVQNLSHELHSAKLEYLGIASAMKAFCNEFGDQAKVEIDFRTHDVPNPLSPDISLCLFRVLQEALQLGKTQRSTARRSWFMGSVERDSSRGP
jgi:signal transduction histidine kinase